MQNNIKLKKRLFPILVPSEEERAKLIEANRKIDAILDSKEDVSKINGGLKQNSIYRLTIMHGPKICNFNCPNYCYTEGIAKGILNTNQVKEVVDQGLKLGIKATYWPGLGELTLLKGFWDIMEYQADKNLPAVVFTNGTILWNNDLANKVTKMSSDELIDKASELGISFYVKYWNSNQNKAAEMSGIKPEEYPFIELNGRNIPLALYNLMQKIPKERLGVEIMVSRENYDDAVENLLPTAKELDIYGYIEPVIFAGKAEGRQKELSLSMEQYLSLADIFASGGTYCEKRQSIDLILVGDRLSPGIVIPPRKEDRLVDDKGNIKDIFEIFHNDYFRKMRRISGELDGCLCRAYWNGEIKV